MAQDTLVIDIRLWLNRLLKNWYWFLISCFVFGLLGIYNYFSTTPEYAVNARIMLRSHDSESPLEKVEMLQVMGMGGMKQTADEIAILTSRDIMTQVVHDLDLQSRYYKKKNLRWIGQYPSRDLTVEYPEMFLDTTKRFVKISLRVRKNDYLVRVRYGLWNFSSHRVTDLTQPFNTCAGDIHFTLHTELERGDRYNITTLPILPAVDMYNRMITAEAIKKESNVIDISTTTDMPSLAIDFINREIELYNIDAVLDKNIMASNTAAFIDERLRLIEKELFDAEMEVEEYKEKFGIVNLEREAGLYLQESTEYRKRAAEIETQINLINYVADFVRDDAKFDNLIPANLGIADATIVSLVNEYNHLIMRKLRVQRTASNENPVITNMTTQLAILRENIIISIANVNNTLTISKADLEKRFGSVEQQRVDIPRQERQYIEVARRKQLKESLYLYLYEKREENALTLASTVTPAKIIATPQMHPTALEPSLKIIFIICVLLGLGVPFVGIYLYYFFNNRLSDDSKELERKTKMPVGGVLVQNHHGEHVAVREGVNSVSAELFRSLRTNIGFMLPSFTKHPVILVTSSVNGEGKSYVATNLAISLSLLNKKVALVGLDIRKPMLAQYLGLPSEGCLTSYLADDSYAVDDLVVSTEFNNLDILPSGIIPPNPNELLQSDRLDQLFVELRQRYDYVIVDSAPVALVSDTFQLSRIADMTVYVCRARYTTFDLVDFLNQVHEQKRLPNIVTVLNGVNAKNIGYGYGYGYGSNAKKR
ncbi:MAG: polysaccharide biosynthesis tyrosine autokinase [Paludibacteraceae bacterium]|nr:polysaccharide biosynthesis tyrosine autokinase [Paludibacteraceae bacterium]